MKEQRTHSSLAKLEVVKFSGEIRFMSSSGWCGGSWPEPGVLCGAHGLIHFLLWLSCCCISDIFHQLVFQQFPVIFCSASINCFPDSGIVSTISTLINYLPFISHMYTHVPTQLSIFLPLNIFIIIQPTFSLSLSCGL